MKKGIIAVAAAVVVIGLGVGYCYYQQPDEEAELYSGILEATEIDVRAEVGGKVLVAPVAEGDKVLAGQTICELDQQKLRLQLQAGEAELTAQQAKLEAMEKGAREQEVEQLRLVLDQARIQAAKAEKDYGRLMSVQSQDPDALSQFELDNAKTMLDLARDNEARADQQYQLVLAGVRDEEKRAQMAVTDAVSAKVALYRLQLEDAIIKSPISGRLIERYVEPGELVLPGGLVGTVASYRRLKLKVYLTADKVGTIRIRQRAVVMIDAFPGVRFRGWVSHKSKQAEFTPKSVQTREERTTLVYEVTVMVENPAGWAITGLPADVKFLPGLEKETPEAAPSPASGATATGVAPGTTAMPGLTTQPGGTALPGGTMLPSATALPATTAPEPLPAATPAPSGSTASPAAGSTAPTSGPQTGSTAPAPPAGGATAAPKIETLPGGTAAPD